MQKPVTLIRLSLSPPKSESQKLSSTFGGTDKDFDSDNTYYGGRFELLF